MNERHAKSSNGFLLGLVFGGLLVFLLGTKRGRALLREISEKGIDALEGFSDLENLDLSMDEDMEEEEFEETEEKPQTPAKQSNGHIPHKRFFKGIKRK